MRVLDLKTNNLSLDFESRELSFVFEYHLMKDTNEGCKYFKDFFDWVNKIGKEGLPSCTHRLKVHPLQATAPADLSETWKLLMRGGTCKEATFPYYCYSAKSSELAYFKVHDH